MKYGKIALLYLIAFALTFGGWATAETIIDDESFLTGVVQDGTMNSITVRLSNGEVHTFSKNDQMDTTGLTNGLTIGNTVILTYQGEINPEEAYQPDVTLLAVADGNFADTALTVNGEESFEFDLDGDGLLETVGAQWLFDESVDYECFALVITGETLNATSFTDIQSDVKITLCDLNPEDDALDLFLSGDVMSDDYMTKQWRVQDGTLTEQADPIWGTIVSAQYGYVVIANWVQVLGSNWGCTRYVPDETGKLSLPDGELWYFAVPDTEEEYRILETCDDTPATFVNGDTETAGVLSAETSLYLTATDRKTVAWFLTLDGQEGYLQITPTEKGWGCNIDGKDESEYFESLPYSG